MPVALRVKSEDTALRAQREAIAQRVLARFVDFPPTSRLLCFLDDVDSPILKLAFGAANRGLYGPIRDSTPVPDWPEHHVTDCIFFDDGVAGIALGHRPLSDAQYRARGITGYCVAEIPQAAQHSGLRTSSDH